jgi:hypothetical protein
VRIIGTFGWEQLVHLVEGNWYIFKILITAVRGNWSILEKPDYEFIEQSNGFK